MHKKLNIIRSRRAHRVRMKIRGTTNIPRLSIFRSNKYISAQLIDDSAHQTLCSATSRGKKEHTTKIISAEYVGKIITEEAKKINITKAVVDRGAYRYHGRVKALVESARKHGLNI